MRFMEWTKDGGPESNVDGFFFIEIKPLFSVALLKFKKGGREAHHEHAFNALTVWLKGHAIEEHLSGRVDVWGPGQVKYTPREAFHKIHAYGGDVWALTFRGPWVDKWREFVKGTYRTLTHGRKVVG